RRGCDVSAVFYMHFSTNHRLPSADPRRALSLPSLPGDAGQNMRGGGNVRRFCPNYAPFSGVYGKPGQRNLSGNLSPIGPTSLCPVRGHSFDRTELQGILANSVDAADFRVCPIEVTNRQCLVNEAAEYK